MTSLLGRKRDLLPEMSFMVGLLRALSSMQEMNQTPKILWTIGYPLGFEVRETTSFEQDMGNPGKIAGPPVNGS
jgi:hypothetical protein